MVRREILKVIMALGAQNLITIPQAEAALTKSRHLGNLSFYNVHTGESLNIHYLKKKGGFDRHACHRLNRFFRCDYDGSIHSIDPRLFLLLDTVRCLLRARERRYCLVSGYRSPTYNRWLRSRDPNVAQHSFHIKGMAADVYMDGVSLHDIERTAKHLRAGGVGSYSDFVHLDLGPVRTW